MSRSHAFCRPVVAAIPLIGLAGFAHADFITFDEIIFPGILTSISADHYASQGVIFGADPHLVDVAVGSPGTSGAFVLGGGTLSNTLVLSTSINQTYIDVSFFMPGSGEAAMTDSFSALFFDSEVGSLIGSMDAYGIDGALLGSVSAITPASLVEVLSFEITGIHRVRLHTDLDGNMIDNLTFGPLYTIPAPGVLATLALAGIVCGRRRRR